MFFLRITKDNCRLTDKQKSQNRSCYICMYEDVERVKKTNWIRVGAETESRKDWQGITFI